MLRRHRQIRTQIHQLMDAGLFAVSFWLAYVLRSNTYLTDLLQLPAIGEFECLSGYTWSSFPRRL